jgi:NADH:ubiquinone oxidoreductase subunit
MSATIGTKLFTLVRGRYIGRDEFGNRYYESRSKERTGRTRRWVIYHGQVEPSKVPAHWHGWLHHTLDQPVTETKRFGWQKPHLPNLTGTAGRYLPAGHIEKAGQRAKATADYQAWKPE